MTKRKLPAHFAGLPKQLAIGGFVFSVSTKKPSQMEGAWGWCSLHTQEILLCESCTAQLAADTFLHEVLHAIHWTVGLDDGATEEQFTTLSAHGLVAFMRANPAAANWWLALLGTF